VFQLLWVPLVHTRHRTPSSRIRASGHAGVVQFGHKASNTLVVSDAQERVMALQRFSIDRAGYRTMKSFARAHRDPVWASKVPAVSGRARPAAGRRGRTGAGRAGPALGSSPGAVAGLRARELLVVGPDDTTEVLRMLSTPAGRRSSRPGSLRFPACAGVIVGPHVDDRLGRRGRTVRARLVAVIGAVTV
jgi:hypothetical protein